MGKTQGLGKCWHAPTRSFASSFPQVYLNWIQVQILIPNYPSGSRKLQQCARKVFLDFCMGNHLTSHSRARQ